MRLILHIGTEKTGTTSIQKYLKENRSLLMEYGFYLPASLGDVNHRKVPGYAVLNGHFDEFHKHNFIHSEAEQKQFKNTLETDLENELKQIPKYIHTIVVTSEHLHSRLIYQEEVDTVKKLFSPFIDEFKIVVYLRRQIDLATSLYSTELKSGNYINDINEFVQKRCRVENHYYNYLIFLSLWEHTFGKETLNIRLFEKNELYQNDLIADFVHVMTHEYSDSILQRSTIPNPENESLSICGQDFMNIINSQIQSFVLQKGQSLIHSKLSNIIINECKGQGKYPDFELAETINNNFKNVNLKVGERYFGGEKVLFNDVLEKYKTIQHKTGEEELNVFSKIIQLLTISITDEDIDAMRDIAVSLEKIDLKKAYELMKIVQNLRPNGSYIRDKIVEYERVLKSKHNED